ncbi:MAG TPA: substrate-binding domain-containing protein [Candidatus Acidoferrales bacterium]|nr:substrate-binding domain-containing protein [Candidatus Acidoferrales bacterium]
MKIQTIRIISMLVAIIASAILLNSPFAAQSRAKTATLRVYTSDGFKPALQALIPKIEKSIGCKVAPSFESSRTLQQKIDSGEAFDVAILSTNVIDDLVKSGKISADTRATLGQAGIGVGVRAGAPKPDISSPEAMKRTLLNAKSIAFNRDGASAVHINEMVEHLGIADKVKPKFMPEVGAGQPQRDVAAGKAQMVITLIPEIADFKGLDLVGPLPSELESYIDFTAGVAMKSQNPAAAKALIKFLKDPSVAGTLKAKGVDTK